MQTNIINWKAKHQKVRELDKDIEFCRKIKLHFGCSTKQACDLYKSMMRQYLEVKDA